MLHVRGSLIVLLGLVYTCHAGGKISMAFITKIHKIFVISCYILVLNVSVFSLTLLFNIYELLLALLFNRTHK